MADYWGMTSIADRMAVQPQTVYRWHHAHNFLMYRRKRKGKPTSWYTNDALIHAWELARCAEDQHKRANGKPTKRSQLLKINGLERYRNPEKNTDSPAPDRSQS